MNVRMKSRMLLKWSLGLCLTVLPFTNGCLRADSSANATNQAAANLPAGITNAVLTIEAPEEQAALDAARTNAPSVDISQAGFKMVEEDRPLPSSVRTSGAAGDLLKLASSGVEEQVMMAYITNSPAPFNLTADEIIYLKDIGVSGNVITSTLHKDQSLNAPGPASRHVPAIQEPAPQYTEITTNWVGAEQTPAQPGPDMVAPQAIASTQEEGAPPAPEGQPSAAPVPQTEVTYSTFHTSLSPYGTWIDLEGYGRVWQPTVVAVNSNWSPYFDCGRWVYTDRGWYWSSDYSWGWAPFHYGRWVQHYRIGWCWSPDLVWGPAWVTWRYNDAYCGWAPLPPAAYYSSGFGFTYYGASVGFTFGFGLGYSCYTYVPWHYYHHHHYNHLHAVPYHRKHDIHNSTKSVTRIVSEKNRIINEGLSAQRVAAATRTQVKPVTVREVRSEVPRTGRAERLDPASRTLTVYRPETRGADRTGGLPMERVRSGFTGGKPGESAVSGAQSAPSQPRTARTTTRTGASSAPRLENPETVVNKVAPPSGQNAKPLILRGPQSQQAQASGGNGQTERRAVPPVVASRSPAVGEQSSPARAPSSWPSARTAQWPQREQRTTAPQAITPQRRSVPQVAAPAQRPPSHQPSVWASPRATETPSRAERSSVTPPSASSGEHAVDQRQQVWASPIANNNLARVERFSQATANSGSAAGGSPRHYSAPAQLPRQSSSGYSAPQRQYSAPATPAPMPRQFSLPQAAGPSAPVHRQFTSPQQSAPAQRQFGSPPSSSSSSSSGSSRAAPAPSRGGGSGRGGHAI